MPELLRQKIRLSAAARAAAAGEDHLFRAQLSAPIFERETVFFARYRRDGRVGHYPRSPRRAQKYIEHAARMIGIGEYPALGVAAADKTHAAPDAHDFFDCVFLQHGSDKVGRVISFRAKSLVGEIASAVAAHEDLLPHARSRFQDHGLYPLLQKARRAEQAARAAAHYRDFFHSTSITYARALWQGAGTKTPTREHAGAKTAFAALPARQIGEMV